MREQQIIAMAPTMLSAKQLGEVLGTFGYFGTPNARLLNRAYREAGSALAQAIQEKIGSKVSRAEGDTGTGTGTGTGTTPSPGSMNLQDWLNWGLSVGKTASDAAKEWYVAVKGANAKVPSVSGYDPNTGMLTMSDGTTVILPTGLQQAQMGGMVPITQSGVSTTTLLYIGVGVMAIVLLLVLLKAVK